MPFKKRNTSLSSNSEDLDNILVVVPLKSI